MIQRHAITDRESWLALRRQDVTASAAAALLGAHPYVTAYSLWAHKTGAIDDDVEMTPAMQRGLMLEDPAVELLRAARPTWKITRARQYFRDPTIRLGATPDAYALDPERGRGLVQVKTVESSVFCKNWRDDDGEVSPPLWIAVQAIVEARLTGRRWACVAALSVGYGIDLHVIDIPLHAGVYDRIRAAVVEFWRLIEAGETPPPDYARDGALIADLYRQDSGETIDLTGDNRIVALIDEMEARKAAEKAANDDLKEIRAEMLAKLGTAAAARTARGLLTAKTVHRKEFTVAAGSYRRIALKPNRDAA